MRGVKIILLAIFAAAISAASLEAASFCKAVIKAFANRASLPPVQYMDSLKVKREVAICGGSECVILVDLPKIQKSDDAQRFFSLASQDSETEFKPCILKSRTDPWFSRSTSFNCHSFSVRSHIPVSTRDWVDGTSAEITRHSNPMKVILDQFFVQITGDLELSNSFLDESHQLYQLRTGDILTFVSRFGTKGLRFIHSMEIVKQGRGVFLRSKLGQGPVVQGSLKNHLDYYEGRMDEVRIYRRRD